MIAPAGNRARRAAASAWLCSQAAPRRRQQRQAEKGDDDEFDRIAGETQHGRDFLQQRQNITGVAARAQQAAQRQNASRMVLRSRAFMSATSTSATVTIPA